LHGFNQGLTLDSKDPVYDIPLFPTTGTAASLAPLVHFDERGDKNNFGPRVGFAWDVRNDTKTVVRADYGIYYNPMNLQITSAEMANYRQPTAIITNPTYPDPYGGRDPLTFVSTAPANIQVMADDLENLQSAAYTAGCFASPDVGNRDPCRWRLQPDVEGPDDDRHQPAQRWHDRKPSAAAVRARPAGAVDWVHELPGAPSSASRSGSSATTCISCRTRCRAATGT
jgi:hypothetical protein